MLSVDIENLSKEECQKYMDAIHVVVSHMEGNRVRISVEDILNNGIPDDLHKAIKKLNIGIAANGHLFDNDTEGFISYLMEDMYTKRKSMKGNMIESQKNIESIKHELHERGIEV